MQVEESTNGLTRYQLLKSVHHLPKVLETSNICWTRVTEIKRANLPTWKLNPLRALPLQARKKKIKISSPRRTREVNELVEKLVSVKFAPIKPSDKTNTDVHRQNNLPIEGAYPVPVDDKVELGGE
jgi:hypothetical protein